jgi:hypothetical protein
VVLPGSSGTGFLVGADLMLTNHHVVQPILDGEVSVQDVHCEFDYLEAADGTPVFTPRTVRLDRAKWNEGSSSQSTSDEVGGLPEPTVEECDYCLLRLDEPIGDEPAGRTTEDPGAEKRGWIQVTDPPPFVAKGQELFVLQHPKGEALSLTIGRTLGFNKAGNRVRHDANTARGSSGSPCLNADLELVALHNAGDPDYDSDRRPEYNQAVPLTPILSLMKNDNVPVFWT